eukprot:gene28866-32056_t
MALSRHTALQKEIYAYGAEKVLIMLNESNVNIRKVYADYIAQVMTHDVVENANRVAARIVETNTDILYVLSLQEDDEDFYIPLPPMDSHDDFYLPQPPM